MLSNHLILCLPLLLLPSFFSASASFPMSWLFALGGQSIGASTSSHLFQWIFKNDFLYNRLVWSPSSSRDAQVSSQHRSLKASILHCPALFMVQLSHLYMTTRKTIPLTIRTFVGKVMSLLFNICYNWWTYVGMLWHNHSSPWFVYLRIHSWYGAFYGYGNMLTCICFRDPKKSPVLCLSIPPHTSP